MNIYFLLEYNSNLSRLKIKTKTTEKKEDMKPLTSMRFQSNSVTEKLSITTGETLKLQNRANRELLRLDSSSYREGRILRKHRLQIDDNSVNSVEDSIERLPGGSGVDPDRVHEANFACGEGLFEE